MRAGSLRDRLTFTRPLNASETTQNSFGEDQGAPAIVGSFWAFVQPLSGRELISMQQKWPQAKYTIKMRHQPNVTFTKKMNASWTPRGSSIVRQLDILDVLEEANISRPQIVMIAQDFQG